MKNLVSIFAAALLLVGTATARSGQQPSSTGSDQSYSQSSAPSNSMSDQSPASPDQQSILVGCVTKRESAYYITPADGVPILLRSNQDLSSMENHEARLTGYFEPGEKPIGPVIGVVHTDDTADSGTSDKDKKENKKKKEASASNATPTSSSDTSASHGTNGTAGDFYVARLDTVASACPVPGQ